MYLTYLEREPGETDEQMAARARSYVGAPMVDVTGIPTGRCASARVTTTVFHRPEPITATVIEVRFDFEEAAVGAQ